MRTIPTTQILKIFMLFLMCSVSIIAQNTSASSRSSSSVLPLTDFLETYKEKHLKISKEIESKPNLSFDEKLLLYQNEVTKLKNAFKSNRKAEYKSKSARRAKRVTCVGTHTRNTTKCAPVYIKVPNENMYTQEDWITIEDAKNIKIFIENSGISLNMSATGKRTNKGVVYATFKYKPESIPAIVDKEAIELFNQMVVEK